MKREREREREKLRWNEYEAVTVRALLEWTSALGRWASVCSGRAKNFIVMYSSTNSVIWASETRSSNCWTLFEGHGMPLHRNIDCSTLSLLLTSKDTVSHGIWNRYNDENWAPPCQVGSNTSHLVDWWNWIQKDVKGTHCPMWEWNRV
jgi:hypothetical protein